MKYKILLLFLTCMMTGTGTSLPSPDEPANGASIQGTVVDSELGSPVEYANVVLFHRADSTLVTGQITDEDGYFRLTDIAPESYYLEVKFIGYHAKTIDLVEVEDYRSAVVLGTISIDRAAIPLEGEEIVADRPAVEFRIDKKVIDVDKQYTAASGTAVDVLENVPSVTVDVEGNVSLRGSTNFTVLIDERPTVLEPSEALQQIPAGTIENIEIITNPSARYDPDGTSGIINIITKKSETRGRSGIGTLNAGFDEKYGFEFLFNDRTRKRNIFIGADYNRRVYPGTVSVENRTEDGDTTFFVDSSGDLGRKRTRYGVSGGIELNLGARDLLGTGVRFGHRSGEGDSRLLYDEWSEPGEARERSTSITDRGRSGGYYSVNVDYRHAFSGNGHELVGQAVYDGREGDEETLNELLDDEGIVLSGRRTTEKGPSKRLRLKLDYALPLNESDRFESGYQSRMRRSEDGTMLFEYDPAGGRYESYLSSPTRPNTIATFIPSMRSTRENTAASAIRRDCGENTRIGRRNWPTPVSVIPSTAGTISPRSTCRMRHRRFTRSWGAIPAGSRGPGAGTSSRSRHGWMPTTSGGAIRTSIPSTSTPTSWATRPASGRASFRSRPTTG